MNSYIEKTDEFECVDGDGHVYIALEFTTTIEDRLLSGGIFKAVSSKDIYTHCGKRLRRHDDGTFEIVSTGEILSRV